MTTATATSEFFGLPWELAPADAARLRVWLRICGTIALLAGIAMPWLPLPEETPVSARVIVPAAPIELSLEQPRRMLPLPPPPPLPPAPKESAPAKADPAPVARAEPRPRSAPEPEAAPAPEGKPAPDARAVAASAGLLAASSALSGLRGAVDTQKLASRGTRPTGVGTAATVDRALLTSHYGTRSAGVNEGALSQGTGGVTLAGRTTTRVGVPGGTGDAGRPGAAGGSASGGTASGTAAGTGQRSIEDIRRVFDANKGAIFAIYHRALREDPALRGQVVLELVIEPGGSVADIRVVSSELGDPALIERLVGRIRMFDFGARDVVRTRISYPVHFLPG